MKALKWFSFVLLFVISIVSVFGVTFPASVTVDSDVTTTFLLAAPFAPDAPAGATYEIVSEDVTKVDCAIVESNTKFQVTPKVKSGSSACTVRTTFNGTTEDDAVSFTVARIDRLVVSDVNFRGDKDESVRTSDRVVAGETHTVVDGGSVDVEPGKTLTVEVEVRNVWPEIFDDAHEIRDIEVEAELDGVGDIDKEDETEEPDDLNPGDDDSVTFTFDFPQLLGDDSGDLTLTIDGRDQDGTIYRHQIKFAVNIEKESHDVSVKVQLTPETLSCNRNGQLDVSVVNVGTNDEDIQLLVKNDQLNLKFFETFELKEAQDEDDDEATYRQTYSFTVPSTIAPGTYPLKVSAFYQGERREATQTMNLNVQACEQQRAQPRDDDTSRGSDDDVQTPSRPQTPQPRQTVEVVQQPAVPNVGTQVVAQPVVASRTPAPRPGTTVTGSVIAMIVGAAVLLALLVVLVVVLVRRH